MSTRRFTLPWQRETRKPGRHAALHPRHTVDAARTSRSGVAAAMALLALTAGTATAVTPLTESTTSAGSTTVVAAPTTDEPSSEAKVQGGASPDTATDSSTVAATAALQRARQVTAESTALSAKEERAITARTEQLTEMLVAREETAASRSAMRTALPEPGTDASSEPDADNDTEPEPDADADADEETTDARPSAAEEAPTTEAELTAATEELTELLEEAESTVQIEAAPATPAEILTAQKQEAADAAAELARQIGSTADYANGRIPSDAMCELSFAGGEMLRCDAAAQLERLDVAYQAKFGGHLSITDTYRSYESQVATKALKGHMAAVPGHSNHGWGIAVDLSDGVESFGTPQYTWLRKHAPAFGWDNPDWARAGGSKPEAWHWEYTPLD
ncbi:hypothetical protein GCM10009718_11810 [Isoptericola halotolerans]|uniref:LAS superfamily LD-carboxypeptidase LdcB n=1 Tax=Isoptericola halotolerans TaxID=300560 RepID=A0ABX2A1T8_9MICO|nr:D-alanyl-D-alanine carboxypeptidase family protein [Isoptericola halotolerans]NOV95898.1 LAS superfamily LD-carboxypeptidase LdcB [Isoptericola halotolerans]